MLVFNHSLSTFVKKKLNLNVIKLLDLTNSLQEEIGQEGHVKLYHGDTTSKIQNMRNDSEKKHPGFFNNKLQERERKNERESAID